MVVLVAKGRYRVVPQRLDTAAATQGFRHVHLKEHGGAFKVTPSSKEKGDELLVPKGRTLFVGNVDDQGVLGVVDEKRYFFLLTALFVQIHAQGIRLWAAERDYQVVVVFSH